MKAGTRFAIVSLCLALCATGMVIANFSDEPIDFPGGGASSSDLTNGYQFTAGDAPLKLSLNEIESIVRKDPTAKSRHGKMEFGSVKSDHGAVLAEVMFRESDGQMQAYLYKLMQKKNSWYVASAQRLWFLPRSHYVRGLRV
jgi:hypothetical protein